MLVRYRTYISIAAAGLLVLLVALWRTEGTVTPPKEQVLADRFWIMKAQNHGKYDIVVMGDSRSYRGVSPTAMEEGLAGYHIYNFAFSSGGLNPQMYRAASTLLDNQSAHRAIIMGVTPTSLLDLYSNNEQFCKEYHRPQSAYFERVYIDPILKDFYPFQLRDLARPLGAPNQCIYTSDYHDDGWVASAKVPEDTTEELSSYKEEMTSDKVNIALIDSLLLQTRKWTAEHIEVFAFRPPATKAMWGLEDQLSNLDYARFEQQFTAVGGHWITVDREGYHSYDGSHIDSASAIKLSKYLAQEIKKHHL